jgi:hypothetical protein
LALSTNNIERIAGLNALSKLEVLSLGRNQIKKLEGLDAVASTLQELWISYNLLEKLVGFKSEIGFCGYEIMDAPCMHCAIQIRGAVSNLLCSTFVHM